MPAIDPATCEWVYSRTQVERDLNGTVVGSFDIYVCVTPGHLGHTTVR